MNQKNYILKRIQHLEYRPSRPHLSDRTLSNSPRHWRMHRRSFANCCSYQISSLFHRVSKVCEYGNHHFLPNETLLGLYGLVLGGSRVPLRGSVEPVCHLDSRSSPSLRSLGSVVQKTPSRFRREVAYCLLSREETQQGPAAMDRMLVDRDARSRRARSPSS